MSSSDPFFSQKTCARCPASLSVRTMSWFTEEVICMSCSDKEKVIKKALRAAGDDRAQEGCGFVPTIKESIS